MKRVSLQAHATLWADTGRTTFYALTHWAEISGLRFAPHRRARDFCRQEVFDLAIRGLDHPFAVIFQNEFVATMRRTKIMHSAIPLCDRGSRHFANFHPADRVDERFVRCTHCRSWPHSASILERWLTLFCKRLASAQPGKADGNQSSQTTRSQTDHHKALSKAGYARSR